MNLVREGGCSVHFYCIQKCGKDINLGYEILVDLRAFLMHKSSVAMPNIKSLDKMGS